LHIALKHRKNAYNLIHSHGFNAGFVSKAASLLLGIPVVHTVHGSHLMDQQAQSLKGKLERWLLTGVAYSAQITVSSTFLAYKRATRSISVIRNGVEVGDFDKISVRKASEPTIIWVGRRDKVKALDVLQNAYAIVKDSLPNAKLNLVSGGRLSGKSLIKAYQQAWVFCLPSYAEGQPITLLEAWAAKLPVVVTRVGDNPHMVKHGINGYLVEPGNPTSLAQELLKLLQSPLKAKRLGINGYNQVKKNNTWDEVVAKTHALYQNLLQS
jgi:glycosyltransferase involved in cell wall biosynthesis